ncbi:hypothetical protein [Streptomyces sp. NPDC086023]|uniref:hypothetical protein n=1 Tax=Streptomyces sp. NPDC086023 TaxID=3365746 RepID=UPI0037D3602A
MSDTAPQPAAPDAAPAPAATAEAVTAAEAPAAPAADATASAAPVPGQAPAPGVEGWAYAPAAPARKGNAGLGIAAAVLAALVTAALYGLIIGTTEYQVGYAAVGVGLLIGLAAGKLGGPNPVTPVLSAILALGAVYAGQLYGVAMLGAEELHTTTLDLVSSVGLSMLHAAWKEAIGPMDFLFFAIGAVVAYQTARKTSA